LAIQGGEKLKEKSNIVDVIKEMELFTEHAEEYLQCIKQILSDMKEVAVLSERDDALLNS